MKYKEVEKHFKCECCTRDHMIIARHERTEWDDPTHKKHHIENEIYLNFVVDAKSSYYGNWFIGLFKNIGWRIKNSFKIIFLGTIRLESDWLAASTEDDTFTFHGKAEVKKLIKFLEDAVKQGEADENVPTG